MKKIAIIVILTFALTIGVSCADIYPMTAIVRELDYTNNLVICEDFNGNEWIFEGIEDWDIDDIASMIMSDMSTLTIEDDEIIMIRYSGYTEGF